MKEINREVEQMTKTERRLFSKLIDDIKQLRINQVVIVIIQIIVLIEQLCLLLKN